MVLRQEVHHPACLVLKASEDALLLIPLTDSFHLHPTRQPFLCWLSRRQAAVTFVSAAPGRLVFYFVLCSAPQVLFWFRFL